MKYPVSVVAERVCALLDENPDIVREKTEYADPGSSVISLVRLFLPDAARIVAASAPVSSIEECCVLGEGLDAPGGEIFSPALVRESPACIGMDLPADFLRLLWFRMSDWQHNVTEPLAFGAEEHRLHRCDPVRGRRRFPAVAIRQTGPVRRLEIYGSSAQAAVAEFGWLAVPAVTDEYIVLPRGLLSALCMKLAEMIRLNLNQ